MSPGISPIYVILFLWLFLAARYRDKKMLTMVSIIFLLAVGCLRNITIGTDYLGYYNDFKLIKSSNSINVIRHTRFEGGFLQLILLCKWLSIDYMSFIGILTFVMISCVVYGLRKGGVRLCYGLFIYYALGIYFVSFNLIRQMLVVSIVFAALELLRRQRYLVFAIVVIIAALAFHRTEVVMLATIPIFIYAKKKPVLNKPLLYVLLVGSFLLFYLGRTFMLSQLSFILSIGNMGMYEGYLTGFWGEEEHGNTVSLMYTFYSLIIVYCKSKNTRVFEVYTYVFAVCVFNIFNIFPTFASRIYHDFYLFILLVVPAMLDEEETKYRKLFAFTTVVFCLGWFIYSYHFNNHGGINPYLLRPF